VVKPFRSTLPVRRSKRRKLDKRDVSGRILDTWLLQTYDVQVLRQRLKADGYVFLPGFLPRNQVLEARRSIVNEMEKLKTSKEEKISLLAHPEIAVLDGVLRVLEHERLFELFSALFDEPAVGTLSFKWLRAVRRGEFTGVHIDRIYVGTPNDQILTAWLPIGDVPLRRGAMAVVPRSHLANATFREMHETYGKQSVSRGSDGTTAGWLSNDGSSVPGFAETLDWHSSAFAAGDVFVLGVDTVHMTLQNVSDHVRISCDTRWQPASLPAKTTLRTTPHVGE
jgi:hypothetical protein